MSILSGADVSPKFYFETTYCKGNHMVISRIVTEEQIEKND